MKNLKKDFRFDREKYKLSLIILVMGNLTKSKAYAEVETSISFLNKTRNKALHVC